MLEVLVEGILERVRGGEGHGDADVCSRGRGEDEESDASSRFWLIWGQEWSFWWDTVQAS